MSLNADEPVKDNPRVPSPTPHVLVVGAGIGGLAAAAGLAARGVRVTVLERAAAPGGKMREVAVDGVRLDAGPTVFTMRWVFDALFAAAGARLDDHLTLRPASLLARHAWSATERLDLFADLDRSAEAIGDFAGAAEARGFRAFSAQAEAIYATLRDSFIRAPRPTPLSLVRSAGLRGLADLWRIRPFDTLWGALGEHFRDPRLRQLFGRYATYCGSSPFLAPATLMLVAHVERDGVWLVEGGMHRLARAVAGLAAGQGAALRVGAEVAEVLARGGRVAGVRLADGEQIEADAVMVNGDAAAVAAGLFGSAAGAAVPAQAPSGRSLSALTWALRARTEGFPLARHTVFFSDAYAAEFDAIFRHDRLPARPTVYVCAQDRDDLGARAEGTSADGARADDAGATQPERLLCLVNAPPSGDHRPFPASEIEACTERSFAALERCGLRVHRRPDAVSVTGPAEFASLFPGTGGALYGQAVHGSMASFRRPGARTTLPGLYLAGGSTHPGAGVPMAALSGWLAAETLLQDLAPSRPAPTPRASTHRFRPAATPGGTSMP